MALLFAISIIIPLFTGRLKIHSGNLLIFLLLSAISMLSILINGDDLKQVVLFFVYMFSALVFVGIYFDCFERIFVNMFYFLAWCSLILWTAFLLFPGLVGLLPTIENSVGYRAHTIIFSAIYQVDNMTIARNMGPFWEPGAYQTFINLALIFVLFTDIFKENRAKYCIIFIATIITTFSTAGYLVAGLILCTYFFNELKSSSGKVGAITKILFMAAFLGTAFLFVYSILPESVKYQLFGKIQAYFDSTSTVGLSSTKVRVLSAVIALQAFFSSPLLGVGMTGMQKAGQVVSNMTTCTPLNWFAYYGLGMGIVCNLGLWKFSGRFEKNIIVKILIMACVILAIISEDYWRNPCILIFVFYGFSYQKQNEGIQ